MIVLLHVLLCIFSDILLNEWTNHGTLTNILWNHVRAVLLKRHKHPHVTRKHMLLHVNSKKEIAELFVHAPEKHHDKNKELNGTENGRLVI